jgi:hypothetical protein
VAPRQIVRPAALVEHVRADALIGPPNLLSVIEIDAHVPFEQRMFGAPHRVEQRALDLAAGDVAGVTTRRSLCRLRARDRARRRRAREMRAESRASAPLRRLAHAEIDDDVVTEPGARVDVSSRASRTSLGREHGGHTALREARRRVVGALGRRRHLAVARAQRERRPAMPLPSTRKSVRWARAPAF